MLFGKTITIVFQIGQKLDPEKMLDKENASNARKRRTDSLSKARLLDDGDCFWINNHSNMFYQRKFRFGSWIIVSG